MKKRKITKTALAMSLVMVMVWALLGTASTVAWFHDTDAVINTFQFGELNVEVYHKTENGYERVTEETKLFDDEALYEPGYTQIVLFKVKNEGTVPFDYKLSVLPDKIVDGTNVFGQTLHLPDYLTFGIVVRDSEAEALAAVQDRKTARSFADTKLNNYDEAVTDLAVDGEQYVALVVCMPEDIGNEANYRVKAASVDLGIKVKATQIEARGKMTD